MERKFVSVKKLLWLIPAALVAYYIYTRSKFTFNLVGFKLKPKPSLIMQVYNPSNVTTKINSISAEIYFKGNRVGIVNQFNTYIINPNNKTNIDLPFTIDGLGFTYLLADIAKNTISVDKKNISIDVNGNINIDGLPISFSKNYKF